jgi:hypothetical protein
MPPRRSSVKVRLTPNRRDSWNSGICEGAAMAMPAGKMGAEPRLTARARMRTKAQLTLPEEIRRSNKPSSVRSSSKPSYRIWPRLIARSVPGYASKGSQLILVYSK